MNQNETSNVNNKVYNFTINDATDSNNSTSNIESNEDYKYSDISYQPSTSDDNNSSSLVKNNSTRENYTSKINYIQRNFTNHIKN